MFHEINNTPGVKPLPPRPGFVVVGAVKVAGVAVVAAAAPNNPPVDAVVAVVVPKSPPVDAVVVVVAVVVVFAPNDNGAAAAVVVAVLPKEKLVEAAVVAVGAGAVVVAPNEKPVVPVTCIVKFFFVMKL